MKIAPYGWMSWALAAAWVGVASPALAADPFHDLSEDEQRRADHGEIIVHLEKTDNPLKRFLVVGQVDAPASRVYAAYTDFDHYSEIFGHKSCSIKRHEGNVLWVTAIMALPWPFGDRWVTNETHLAPEDLSFTYRRTEGNIPEYVGEVSVVPRGTARCQVYYMAKVDPGIPFLPRWVLERVQEANFPDAIRDVRSFLLRQAAN